MTEFAPESYDEKAEKQKCNCAMFYSRLDGNLIIIYCPKHAAAPDVFENASRLVHALREYDADDNDMAWQKVANALRATEAALALAGDSDEG